MVYTRLAHGVGRCERCKHRTMLVLVTAGGVSVLLCTTCEDDWDIFVNAAVTLHRQGLNWREEMRRTYYRRHERVTYTWTFSTGGTFTK